MLMQRHHYWQTFVFTLMFVFTFVMPAQARDSLGIFESWGAFRDGESARCYAISKAIPSTMHRDFQPYADVASWPRKGIRGQVHFRVSRPIASGSKPVLTLGNQRFELIGGGADLWAQNKQMDAAIVAAIRSTREMMVSARGGDGHGFSNTWPLAGAATAIDAAAIGCAGVR